MIRASTLLLCHALLVGRPGVLPAADYLKDVKPLLEHKCYACHGAIKQSGGLRLDTAKLAMQGGDSGSPIVAHEPQNSLLIDVLTGDAGFQMPPANEGVPLTEEEIELVRDWIKAGAPQPEDEQPQTDPQQWWSYRAVDRPKLPSLPDTTWCRNEIDHFIAAKRSEHDLPHTGDTSKLLWLRRVYLDLIGLPPTLAEQQRFVADDSAEAFENVVDELLARPQYGERWGRHFMDVWRYSDWYGSRGINEIRYSQRHIWRWRDWIVASLNEDKGYDQMIREMLAADEIAGDDSTTLAATGYLGRNWYKFDRNVWMFETVERTGEAFLGLTFRCCRCHDHKFDPVTQEEYYRFRAFFEPHDVRTDLISAATETQKDSTLGQVLQDGVALVYDKTLDVKTYRFERGDSRYPDEENPLLPGVPASLGGSVSVAPVELPVEAWYPMLRSDVRKTLLANADAKVQQAKKALTAANTEAVELAAELAKTLSIDEEERTDVEPTVILQDDFTTERPDVWQVVDGKWSYTDGKLAQTAVTSFATMATKQKLPTDFDVHLRYRPLSPGVYRSVGFSFDYQDKGNSQDVYTSTGDARQSVQAFHRVGGKTEYPEAGIVNTSLKVEEEAVLDVSVDGTRLTIDLNGERKLEYLLPVERREGMFALWVHSGAAEFHELKITGRAASVETLRKHKQAADAALEIADSELKIAEAEAASVRKRLAAELLKYGLTAESSDEASLQKATREAILAERNADVLRARGELLKAQSDADKRKAAEESLARAEEAAANIAGTYSTFGEQFPKTSTGRRSALAEWITDKSNPRTARVAVNHVWGRHFGRPLVGTPENFGLNGQKPTHPLLMDWLASELMANDWKLKPLHRQIVLSSTYRMTSMSSRDDNASQSDPQNTFLWRMNSRRMEAEVVRDATLYLAGKLDLQMGGPEIPETDGETTPRRSLYFRNTPNEKMLMLEVFDVADPNSCYRRKESVVPHQSLAMMNSGLTQDAAREVAGRLANEPDFVSAAFQTLLGRPPSDDETERCQSFLVRHSELLKSKNEERFAPGGSSKTLPAEDVAQRSRENLVHVLFLHNDFVTIR